MAVITHASQQRQRERESRFVYLLLFRLPDAMPAPLSRARQSGLLLTFEAAPYLLCALCVCCFAAWCWVLLSAASITSFVGQWALFFVVFVFCTFFCLNLPSFTFSFFLLTYHIRSPRGGGGNRWLGNCVRSCNRNGWLYFLNYFIRYLRWWIGL